LNIDHSLLKEKSRLIRRDIIEMLHKSGSGHPGGSLSATDIVTALYFHQMNIDPKNPKWVDRDRFVLSKGHAAPVVYAVLAEKGYFDKKELSNLRQVNSMLQGHPDMKGTPGVEMSTGSLGQGFSAASGMAIAGKMDNKDYRVYVLLGDGELQEGIIWETAMSAVHYKLDNLTAIIDYNKLQIDGTNSQVMGVDPITDKFTAFGWNVLEIDGHCFEDIITALEEAKNTKGKPTVIVAHTIKGKGVSFMENQVGWHGNAPKDDDREKALKELGGVNND